jgi:plastocyanin domain-containing protein
MDLKLGQKLLVIGGVLVAIGIMLVASTFLMIEQSSYSFSTSTQTVSVGELFSKTIEAQAGTNMTVVVEVQPPEVPMQLQVRQPDDDIISNISFNNRTSATFTPITDGEYTIIIANLGNEQASMNMLAGTNPFFALDGDDDGNQQQANVALGAMAISGPILGGIGFIVIVIGAIVYFLRERRRARRT